jgi:putative ABC transport system permease protein
VVRERDGDRAGRRSSRDRRGGPASRALARPQSPPYNVRTLEADISRVVAAPRFAATVIGLFAAAALVMAFVGVYGVMTFAAGRRTHEIGVRLAMGATRAHVIALMLRDGVVVVAAGLALGGGAALLFARTLTGVLHEVTPVDPPTLIGMAAVLAAAALAASLLPACRATRIDPLQVLRES